MSGAQFGSGYVSDVDYPAAYHRELSPAWLNYVAALNGVAPRDVNSPFRYLELGCGTGYSSLVHAAAFPAGEFHACDFSASSIAAGREHARRDGVANINYHERRFADLLEHGLGEFNFVALHGVYSWIDAREREIVRAIVGEALTPGGLVYLSYNCMPGWAPEVPLRRLLLELAAALEGDTAQRAEQAALALKDASLDKLGYFAANPAALAATEAYAGSSGSYLAHEFFNETWEPLYSIDVIDEMAAAGVAYVGSATLANNHPELLAARETLNAIPPLQGARERQLLMDLATNCQFRRDVFVRPSADTRIGDAAQHLDGIVVGAADGNGIVGRSFRVPRGKIDFQPDFLRALEEALAPGPTTLGAIVARLARRGSPAAGVRRNLLYLIAAGGLAPMSHGASRR